MRLLILLAIVELACGHGYLPVTSTGGGGGGRVQQQSYYSQQHTQASQSSAPGSQYYQLGPDGSYSYGFNTGTGSYQSEQKHGGGQVTGNYGHANPDGSYVNVQYQAVQTGESGAGDVQYREGTGAYQAVQYSHTLPVQPGVSSETAQATFDRKTDGSYSINVQSREQSRTETGTADGQVQGGYTYIGDDGVQRSVSYTAGREGFVATGDHLPRDDNTPTYQGTPVHGASAAGGTYSTYTSTYGTPRGPVAVPPAQPYPAPGGPVVPATPQTYTSTYQSSTRYRGDIGVPGGPGPRYQAPQAPFPQPGYGTFKGSSGDQYINESPKPFSFSYDAGGHGRKETQDASGVVRGSYIVNSPDGSVKELSYQADDDGFHIVDEKIIQGAGGHVAGGGGAGYSVGGSAAVPAGGGISYNSGSYSSRRTGGGYQTSSGQQFGTSYTAGATIGGARQPYKPKSTQPGGASSY